jgi:hypothetical protein
VNRSIFALTLLMLVAAFSFAPVMAQTCLPVDICKELVCFSDKEPYYVGMKYYWWIRITVHANENVSNVIVYDRLGAELMIEGVSVGLAKPVEYNFTYEDYEWNGVVKINGVPEGYLNKDGVIFGDFDEFEIYWTGKSVKAHFQWNVGSMSECETKAVFLIVSTDHNPADHQEYTSCGWYWLNSGATVKGILDSTGKQFSAESDGIQIYVECPPC